MQKFQIKTKRDWFIAFIFSFLLIYLIVSRFQVVINDYILTITPNKISFFNQPEDHGVYMVTVLLTLVLSICVMVHKNVKRNHIAMALAVGLTITAGIIGSYYYECHQILRIPSECKPNDVTVSYYDNEPASHINYTLDEVTKEQIVEKVLALEPLSKDKRKMISDMDKSSSGVSISIWYREKHDHSYHIWVYINNDVIRIHKGHNVNADPIYQDNGLLEILEKIS